MLIVAPMGSKKLTILLSTLVDVSKTSIVRGSVAWKVNENTKYLQVQTYKCVPPHYCLFSVLVAKLETLHALQSNKKK